MSTPGPDPRTATALDRVRAELAALPDMSMPPDVVDRIERALADASVPDEPGRTAAAVPEGGTGRRGRPSRRVVVRAGVALTAVAAAVLVAVLLVVAPADRVTPVARDDDLRTAGSVAFGRDGAGPLADPARRHACLAAAGVPDPDATLLGGAPYAVDGRPGTMLVLSTGVAGRFRAVVVDPGCGPSGGRVLGQAVVGR